MLQKKQQPHRKKNNSRSNMLVFQETVARKMIYSFWALRYRYKNVENMRNKENILKPMYCCRTTFEATITEIKAIIIIFLT